MNLTDDWKDGTLKSGWYYLKFQNETVDIDFFDEDDNSWLCNSDKDYIPFEIIAPVPSWGELSHLETKLEWQDKRIAELKELLGECKKHMYFQKEMDNETITLLTRINTAIGESEE